MLCQSFPFSQGELLLQAWILLQFPCLDEVWHSVLRCSWYDELSIRLGIWLCMQALKEAFEVFCNKGVAGSTSAELLATFCDNLLKKGGSEKLSDEAIEDTLEKVLVA